MVRIMLQWGVRGNLMKKRYPKDCSPETRLLTTAFEQMTWTLNEGTGIIFPKVFLSSYR